VVFVERIRGTGIFQDPNDFGLILVMGLIFIAASLFRPRAGWPRYLWLIPGGVLLATLSLTHSRGAFFALACAIPAALSYARNWRVGALSLLGLPLLTIVFSARATDLNSIVEGTGQSRIQIWSQSLAVWRQYPVFGLGEGLLVEELGVVAHNSFLHCFAELGILGGTAFLSCFLAAGLGLWSLRSQRGGIDPSALVSGELRDIAHLRVFVFAALAAYSAGMLSISRQFVMPTYLILGLATATQSLQSGDGVRWRIGNRFLLVVLSASAGMLLTIYLMVRVLARW
jgi:O-antigen ligase